MFETWQQFLARFVVPSGLQQHSCPRWGKRQSIEGRWELRGKHLCLGFRKPPAAEGHTTEKSFSPASYTKHLSGKFTRTLSTQCQNYSSKRQGRRPPNAPSPVLDPQKGQVALDHVHRSWEKSWLQRLSLIHPSVPQGSCSHLSPHQPVWAEMSTASCLP